MELLRLGFGFFLPFFPFMVLFSLLFTATFYLFGEDFLHSGDYFAVPPAGQAPTERAAPPPPQRRAPAYIVPEALLAEPTVDRMVPFARE